MPVWRGKPRFAEVAEVIHLVETPASGLLLDAAVTLQQPFSLGGDPPRGGDRPGNGLAPGMG